jgi:hypothetical protein
VASSFPTRILKPGHGFERKTRDKFRAVCQVQTARQCVAA